MHMALRCASGCSEVLAGVSAAVLQLVQGVPFPPAERHAAWLLWLDNSAHSVQRAGRAERPVLVSCCCLADLQAEGSEAKKELAPEYVENQKSVDTALLGSLSDDLKVGVLLRAETSCLAAGRLSRQGSACGMRGVPKHPKASLVWTLIFENPQLVQRVVIRPASLGEALGQAAAASPTYNDPV
jgi:hypothetical protein